MTDEFKKIIDDDIKKCEQEIKGGSRISRYDLHTYLKSKYAEIIDGFDKNLPSLYFDDNGKQIPQNIEIMRDKLLLFKAMEYENCYSKETNTGITVNNSNQLSTSINISFEDTKKQIEDMTSLRDEEIEEIHKKIDELEEIINSSDRKTKKWAKATGILKWIADKSVDVGVALLPLFLKIDQQT